MDILINPASGEVLVKLQTCLVKFPETNNYSFEGPADLMLPSIESVAELTRELHAFLDATKAIETHRVIEHKAA